jgi:magnesium transporter
MAPSGLSARDKHGLWNAIASSVDTATHRALSISLPRGLIRTVAFRKRRPPVGARPGTLAVPGDAPPPRLRLTRYRERELVERELVDPGEIAAHRLDGWVLWLDVQGLGDESLLRALAGEFDIHPLALEDIVHAPQRPKAEEYDAHDLLVSRHHVIQDDRLAPRQVSIVLGTSFVLSFCEDPGEQFLPVQQRLQETSGPLRSAGADYLAYALLDTLIDGYYPIFDQLAEQLDQVESQLLDRPTPHLLAQLSSSKSMLSLLRRGILPQRDALQELVRGRGRFITDPVRVYLRDPLDHCSQLADVLESHREMSSELINLYVSMVSNRTNEVMRILTIMSSIFIPLTFLAGIYGMNFDYMPELRQRWAYPALLLFMTSLTAVMLVYFRRKGWLGRQDRDG